MTCTCTYSARDNVTTFLNLMIAMEVDYFLLFLLGVPHGFDLHQVWCSYSINNL